MALSTWMHLHDPPVICQSVQSHQWEGTPSQTHTQVRYESFVGCESTTHAVANPTNLPSSLSAKVRVVLSLITGITTYPVYLHSPLLQESCMIFHSRKCFATKYDYVKTVGRDWALILRGLSVGILLPHGTVCKALDYRLKPSILKLPVRAGWEEVSWPSFFRTFLPFQGIHFEQIHSTNVTTRLASSH